MRTDPDPRAGGLEVVLDRVTVRFGARGSELTAVADCSLVVPPGSFTVIIGPNGSGKSTLLRLVAGLLAPSEGAVSVGGSVPRAGDGRVGLAFQQPRLVPWRTTLANVALPLELDGVSTGERHDRARAALRQVGLEGAAGLRPAELSGGMAQRAALARALITDPQVLLLDEPFSALDALTREAFDAELQRLWIDRRRTVILVTNSVAEAVELADRVAIMSPRPGRIARVVEIDLPRPRPADVVSSPVAARLAAAVREELAAGHPPETATWASAGGAS
jgi:NitT/TauT family transport system ATP-binding protein